MFLFFFIVASIPLFAQQDYKVVKIEFLGNDTIPEDALLNIMNTKALTSIQKLTFWKSNALFSPYILNEDLVRIKKYYQRNGFLDPVVTSELFPHKKKEKINIKVLVSPGKAIVNDHLNYTLVGDTANSNIGAPDVLQLPLKSGKRFRDEDVIKTEAALSDFYTNRGYPFTQLSKEVRLNEKAGTAHVDFTIAPQERAYFGAVQLRGDSLISHSYIYKHIKIQEGSMYSQAKLDETQEALFDLGLFKYVTIRAQLDSVENAKVPVVIQLKEMSRWSFKTGLGYGTEDRLRISARVTGLNFLGGGRTFILNARHSYYIPISIDAKFIQPDAIYKDLDFILNPFYIREREDWYVVDRLGTSLTFQKSMSDKSLVFASYNLGLDRVDMSSSGTSSSEVPESAANTKSGVSLGFRNSSTDNTLDPTKGLKYSLTTSYMGLGFNSDYHYYKLVSEVDYFIPITPKVVLASKLKGGIIAPIQGDPLTPIEDRFLMGGALSVRGWGRNKISPVNVDGDKVGGNTMLESSLELRFPIYAILSGATFIDVGNVWSEEWQVDLKDLRSSVGVGLRISSPIGPIRFDVATPLAEDISATQFYITVGHAF